MQTHFLKCNFLRVGIENILAGFVCWRQIPRFLEIQWLHNNLTISHWSSLICSTQFSEDKFFWTTHFKGQTISGAICGCKHNPPTESLSSLTFRRRETTAWHISANTRVFQKKRSKAVMCMCRRLRVIRHFARALFRSAQSFEAAGQLPGGDY